MPCQGGSRCWHLPFAYDRLSSGVPVPQQHGTVRRTGRYVTIRGYVALRPGQAGDHPVVPEDYLDYFGRFGGKHPEAVVPEAASYEELAVDCGDEAVGAYLQVLTEVVAQVSPLHLVLGAAVVGLG